MRFMNRHFPRIEEYIFNENNELGRGKITDAQ